jgi:hypothetical protein
MMMNYAKDLHRKGELNKVNAMEKLGKKMIKGKDMGLAFLTEAFYVGDGVYADGFGVIANQAKFSEYEGAILFNDELNKPVFLSDNDLMNGNF